MGKIIGQEQNKKVIKRAIELDLPILLVGDTGTGKTSVIREMANTAKKDLVRVNLNGQTSIDEFVGKWLVKKGATYWQDGVLIQAMKKGSWIVLDEINACLPEILFVLHSLLDEDRSVMINEKDGEVVKPAKGFRFFATMNPSDEYAGTKELNKAFMSRFPIILDFDYVDAQQEKKLLKERCKLSEGNSAKLVGFARRIRSLKKNEDIFYTFSTRDLIFWGNFHDELGLRESFRVTILNRAHNGDKDVLQKEFNNYFGEMEKMEEKFDEPDIMKILEQIKQELSKQEQRKEWLEKMEQNLREQEKLAKEEIEKMLKKMKEEHKDNQDKNEDNEDKKEKKEKERKEKGQTGSSIKVSIKTAEEFIKGMPEEELGNNGEPQKDEPTDDKPDEGEGTGAGSQESKAEEVPMVEVAPSPLTCSHECDSCPSKAECLEDIKGVK